MDQRSTNPVYVSKKAANMFLLHFSILLYAFVSIFAKLAGTAGNSFVSLLYISIEFALLFLYAFLWQIILKRMALTFAFANKAISVVWTVLLGIFLFNEQITWTRFSGIVLVIIGIIVVAKND